MPRISREAALAKESFVMSLFATNPAITNKEVQDAVKTKFGGAMNADKVKDLKARATGTTPIATTLPMAQVEPAVESTETIVAPEPVQAQAAEPTVTPETETPFTPTPVVQVAAPKPIAAVEPVDPVLIPMEQVTDGNGTHIRAPTPETGKRKQIVPGLEEVVAND